jgi:FlaA1/EpsC-like NDP-sugar epimerase
LIGASRFWERAAYRGVTTLRTSGPRRRGARRRRRPRRPQLRAGARETPGEQIVGFVDDDPRLWRRRLIGVPVLGAADEMPEIIAEARPDLVFVSIPDAPSARLDLVFDACVDAGVDCRIVRREIEAAPYVEPEPTNVRSIRSRGGR